MGARPKFSLSWRDAATSIAASLLALGLAAAFVAVAIWLGTFVGAELR